MQATSPSEILAALYAWASPYLRAVDGDGREKEGGGKEEEEEVVLGQPRGFWEVMETEWETVKGKEEEK